MKSCVAVGGMGREITHPLHFYRASTLETTSLTPVNLVFGRELRLPCDLLFGVPPDREQPTIDYIVELVNRLHDIQNYTCQHLQLVSDRIKTLMTAWQTARAARRAIECDCIAQTTQQRSHPNFKLHGMAKQVTRISIVTYRIQWNPRTKIIVVHPDRLAAYQGVTLDEQPMEGAVGGQHQETQPTMKEL
jgi:hypothetical protein